MLNLLQAKLLKDTTRDVGFLFEPHLAVLIIEFALPFTVESLVNASLVNESDQRVACLNVEINVRQWLQPHILLPVVPLDVRDELQEEAQFTNLRRLLHDIHTIQVADNY